MFKGLTAVTAAFFIYSGIAGAATLNATFTVIAINAIGLDSAQSKATSLNVFAALDAATAGTAGYTSDTFDYVGALDFATSDETDGTTIAGWLQTGAGTITGLDQGFGDLQLSKPDVDAGTATTTFFAFISEAVAAGDFTIKHDDGVAIYEDFNRIGGFDGPNGVRETAIYGFGGGPLGLLYVATNGDPSVLHVDLQPVPLPAGLLLLLTGIGGFALLRRQAA